MRGYHSSCPATLPLVSPLLKPSGWTAVSFAHCVLWLIVSDFLTLAPLSFTFTLCFTSSSNLPLTSSYFLSLSQSLSLCPLHSSVCYCISAELVHVCESALPDKKAERAETSMALKHFNKPRIKKQTDTYAALLWSHILTVCHH